jgi:phosphoglycolate phosphatase-like HAD superfamily hydrolase
MKLNLNKYTAFFFDFDGVIADSLHIKTEAFGELFKIYGPEIQKKVIDYHRNNGGVSRYEKFKHYYHNLLNKKIDQKIMNRLDKQYSKLVVDKVVAAEYIPGVLEFIKKLNKMDRPSFVVSGTPQKEIRDILRRKKIRSLFKDAVGSPKNKADNLKSLLNRHEIDPLRAIFFGDAKSDWEAAAKNKVDFISVVNHSSKELEGYASLGTIRDFTGVSFTRNHKEKTC